MTHYWERVCGCISLRTGVYAIAVFALANVFAQLILIILHGAILQATSDDTSIQWLAPIHDTNWLLNSAIRCLYAFVIWKAGTKSWEAAKYQNQTAAKKANIWLWLWLLASGTIGLLLLLNDALILGYRTSNPFGECAPTWERSLANGDRSLGATLKELLSLFGVIWLALVACFIVVGSPIVVTWVMSHCIKSYRYQLLVGTPSDQADVEKTKFSGTGAGAAHQVVAVETHPR